MNLETVWTEEMTLLTTLKFYQLKDIFHFIDQRYSKNFPDSVSNQIRLVKGRQLLEKAPAPVSTAAAAPGGAGAGAAQHQER